MPALLKYLLIQFPQWCGLGLFLWLLVDRSAAPGWAATGFFLLWILKDLAVYPLVRRAYENDTKTGAERLIGGRGVARQALAPEGYVRIQGELWKARTAGEPISPQQVVHVTGVRGMTLIVEAEKPS